MNSQKPKQYYEDRYDLNTIEQCLNQLKMLDDIDKKMRVAPEFKNYPESELKKDSDLIAGRFMFAIRAQRYKERASTIAEWMAEDKIKQDKLDNALPPKVNCPKCGALMIDDDFKTLEDEPLRVLFNFSCPKCKKREGVYEDGEVWVYEPSYCSECGKELKTDIKIEGNVTTFTTKCTGCKYKNVDVHDHAKREAELKVKEQRDAELLAKYRDEFCLNEEKGKEYVDLLQAIEVGFAIHDEIIAEMDNPAQEKLMKVRKLSITDLEILLNKALTESGFTRLSIGSPDISRHVSVPFTIRDTVKRYDLESIAALHGLLKNALKETNWRAPKDELSYRLGFISGRLKGYENEEDLLKLFGREETKKPKSKLDPELRAKYEHHNYVQLARINAEFEVETRIRTRRLKEEPEGFYLNDGGRGYTCAICRGHHDGEDIWWRPDGLRCRDCWNNIKKGVIPMLKLDAHDWEKEFFDKYEITDKRGIHPSSIKKLRREGVLVGRDLKDASGNIYETIYLVSENEKFLINYKNDLKN